MTTTVHAPGAEVLSMSAKPVELVEAEFVTTGYSLEKVKPSIMQIVAGLDKMVSDAKALEIKDEESAKFATALGGYRLTVNKGIEAKRKEIVAAPNAFVKSVNGFCKIFTDKLEVIDKTLDKKMRDYRSRVELERRERERKQKVAVAELQKKLQAEADEANRKAKEEAVQRAEEEAKAKSASKAQIEEAKTKAEEEAKKIEIEAPTVVTPVFQEEKRIVRAETGSSSFETKSWKAEIEDPSLVPIQFCSPDQKKINEAVKAGMRQIPGVHIYEAEKTHFRA